MSRLYVGILKGGTKREVFRASATPTSESHGHIYGAVIGPFRSLAAANLASGAHGPLLQSVADFERAVKKNPESRERSRAEALEVDFVDRSSMDRVLEALREIAYGKAQHVLENWQDRALARAWERVGKAIDKAQAVAMKEKL